MKVYAISGLGVDERVFKYLDLNFEIIHLNWIKPQKNESIESYASRLSKSISTEEKFGLIGLSFGGMVATEIAKQKQPEFIILISSAENKHELRPIYRFIGALKLPNVLPQFCFKPPKQLAYFIFGAKNKALLNEIINELDLYFTKWAVSTICSWKNTNRLGNIIKIGGTKDKLLPQKDIKNTIYIKGGAHFMIVDNAKKVSLILNEKIYSFTKTS